MDRVQGAHTCLCCSVRKWRIILLLIQNSIDAYRHFSVVAWPHEIESLALLAMSRENAPLRSDFVARGTVDAISIPIREIARFVLDANAAGLVIAHNHPCGDISPSADDILATRRISLWLRPLGVELMDHLILSQNKYLSLRDCGIV